MANTEVATLAAIRDCRDHIAAMCEPLDETAWHAPTALPGWDVQDVVAHLGSLEGYLLGREQDHADGRDGWPPHVRNQLGQLNERLVERRRPWSPAEVLGEYRETSELRLEQLAAATESDLDVEVPAPTGGSVPLRRFLGIRLWDYCIHELDIADALGATVRVGAPATGRVLDEMTFLSGRALGRSGPPEGSALRIDLGDPPRVLSARVQGGRGVLADVAAGEASLHLRASPTAFLRVATGRRDPAVAIAKGELTVTGDGQLAATVLSGFNLVP